MGRDPINSSSALGAVAAYFMNRPNHWFDSHFLYKNIHFEEEANVTKHGLAQTLSLTAAYGDPHGFLSPVSQIRVLSKSRTTPYGIFYGYRNNLTPGSYNVGWRNSVESGRKLMLSVTRIRNDKVEEFPMYVRVIDSQSYEELKKDLVSKKS